MTPEALLAGRTQPLRLVIFDCDGVIADSEGIASRITSSEISKLGWVITPEEADHHFLGKSLAAMLPVIEAHIGHPVPPDWIEGIRSAFLTLLAAEVEAIPGAVDALDGVTALGLPWRIASNSSHEEMGVKFDRMGLKHKVHGRTHSHRDVARGKPAPDLFLATAAAEGVSPAECVVIEDSVTGATAAAAAGMDCLAYAPKGDAAALRSVGAVPFRSMFDLPGLIALARRSPA